MFATRNLPGFFRRFSFAGLAASRRLPLLVERFLLKCFHLVAFNLVTFNLAPFNLAPFNLAPFNLGAFNLDTSFAVRQLTSYSLARRLPIANYRFVLADCVTLFFIDDRCVTAHS